MEPYVPNDEPLLLEGDSKHSEKKKKKKKKSKDGGGGGDDDDDESSLEMTTMTSKPKSEKKPKSSRKPKSEKKPKKSSKRKSGSGGSAAAEDMHPTTAAAKSVVEASGFEPLNAKDLNAKMIIGGGGEEEEVGGGFRYAITGNESQVVTFSIPPGGTCQGEPGSMLYLTDSVDMSATCEGGACARCLGGESCCLLSFTNGSTSEIGFAGLTTNLPMAKVVPVHMDDPAVGGTLVVQQGSYAASYGDVSIGFSCDFNICRCLFGGMSLVRQKITGSGVVFLGATGTIVQKVLEPGEVLLCDTNCLLAYSESCAFDLKRTGGILGMIGGGEGIFNSSVTGPGLVIVQSMNMCVLLQSLAADKIYRR